MNLPDRKIKPLPVNLRVITECETCGQVVSASVHVDQGKLGANVVVFRAQHSQGKSDHNALVSVSYSNGKI